MRPRSPVEGRSHSSIIFGSNCLVLFDHVTHDGGDQLKMAPIYNNCVVILLFFPLLR